MDLSKRIKPFRIAFAALALIGALTTSLHWLSRGKPVPEDPLLDPWIGLPSSGMDASGFNARRALGMAFHAEDNYHYDSLAFDCGNTFRETALGDRYIARVGKDAFHAGWTIKLEVRGNKIEIAWKEAGLSAPPLPPPSARRADGSHDMTDLVLIQPTSHASMTRKELEQVRLAWDKASLWHSPQDSTECLDGVPIFLEACVAGRYAARFRNCNQPNMDDAQQLWQAFSTLLPAPAPAQYRQKGLQPN